MDRFFYQAKNVVIWLGEGDEGNDYAIDYIVNLVNPQNEVRRSVGRDDLPGYVAIAQLLNREWFSRIWIIQEVAFAKNPVVPLWSGRNTLHGCGQSSADNSKTGQRLSRSWLQLYR
jgi:hypothetical protein